MQISNNYTFLPMKNIVAVLLVILITQFVSAQKIYHVSQKGNDNNTGSIEKPFKNITKVNKLTLKPGDHVLFKGGDIFSGNLEFGADDAGIPSSPVKIGSYGDGRAIISAGAGTGLLFRNAGGVEVENLILKGNGYETNNGSGIGIVNELPENIRLKHIRIRNIEATGFGRDISKLKGEAVGLQSPAGQGIFVGGNASDGSKSGFSDVVIENSLVYENEFYGILVSGYWQDNPSIYANENVTIRNCIAHHIHGDPKYMDNHSGSGIFLEDTDHGLIEFCTAYENGKYCSGPFGGPCGIWTAVANKVTIQYCESYQNRTNNGQDGDGFDIDGGSTNCILQYNYSHDNDGQGYLICSYDNAPFTHNNNTIRYNISVNDSRKLHGGSIMFWTNGKGRHEINNTYVYGNTFYNDENSSVDIETPGVNNVIFANNIFISGGDTIAKGLFRSKSLKFINNCYWSPKGTFNIEGYKTLAQWRNATGQELYMGKETGIFADPLFATNSLDSSGTGNNIPAGVSAYKLSANSPLINAGMKIIELKDIGIPAVDFFGNAVPQSKGIDIGAHEFKPINKQSYTYRGYLGWMVDFSRSPVYGQWPSIRLDSAIIADYTETLNFMQQSGMNHITLWGLFTDENWDPDISKTITPERKKLVERVIDLAHQKNIRILCGVGLYSWGFGKILQLNPLLACKANPSVINFANPDSWEWQKRVLDYLTDNYKFDGLSMQSADKGWCSNGTMSEMQYHATMNQRVAKYVRSKKPDYILGICGWGMNLSNPSDLPSIVEMTRDIDFLIDVGETASFGSSAYQQMLINTIAPCAYGNTATPNIEPIQAMQRDMYFVPTVFETCKQLQNLHALGADACEAYARTRGNPADRVTIEVVARTLANPMINIDHALVTVLKEIYQPSDTGALQTLVDIFSIAEEAFFKNRPVSNPQQQYNNVILLMPREQQISRIDLFDSFTVASKEKYLSALKTLPSKCEKISSSIGNKSEIALLKTCIENTIFQLKKQ